MTRRRRLILKHSIISLSVLLVATGVLLFTTRGSGRPYVPGQMEEGITDELTRDIPPGYPRVEFTDVAEQAGIRFTHFPGTRSTQLPEDMGSGAAWGDYDGDGDPDLYVVDIAGPLSDGSASGAEWRGGNRLYRNNGDSTFTDVTSAAGVGFKGIGMGAAWADYDNDGRLDLVVTSYGQIVLYRNVGDGRFEDVSVKAGFVKFNGFWAGASWADYDRDGFADLYVCGYVKYVFRPEDRQKASSQYVSVVPYTLNPSSYPPERNLLFHNNGDGTFRELSEAAGVSNPTGRSLSAAWYDYNGDDLPDLYVANDISDNAMYLNLGNGRFKDVSHAAWVADYRGAMGLAVADWDRDGDADIFITHWIAQENSLFSNLNYMRGRPGKKNPELHFQDEADMLGLGQKSLSVIGWGTGFLDYDNDGQLDIFAVNGSTFQQTDNPSRLVPMQNFLFWQKSPNEGFFDVAPVAGKTFRQARVGRGMAFADYDNDGDLDLFLVNYQGQAQLLRNDGGNAKNWLKVRVQPAQNRPALGARVEVQAAGETQYHELGGQPSYLSQPFLEAHFGLGSAASATRVRVRFPGGAAREFTNVATKQTLVVAEAAP